MIEAFHKTYPNYGYLGISNLKNDDASHTMFYRLFYEVPTGAKCRKFLIHKLVFARESDALIKLFIDTALNKAEDEDTRIAAMNDLYDTKWPKAQQALAEIYRKINDEKYHEHMLDVAINAKEAALAEVFLGYYRHFHPDNNDVYAYRNERLQALKAQLAEDAKNPKPDPLALARAGDEWWNNFIRKEHKVTLLEAKTGLANFAKTPVLERLELAYAIQQSVVPDADLVKRLEHLIPDEPSALVKSAMIDTVAMSQPNAQARLQYYRRLAAKEKNTDVVKYLKNHIKIIEDGVIKR